MAKTFREIVAWQRGMELARRVYELTRDMPPSERYGLQLQARRAAVAVPSNIAEGFGRRTREDFLRFLRIARGSLFELQTQLELARDLGFCQLDGQTTDLLAETDRVLQAFMRGLEESSGAPERAPRGSPAA
jgi:four helix bundle protein